MCEQKSLDEQLASRVRDAFAELRAALKACDVNGLSAHIHFAGHHLGYSPPITGSNANEWLVQVSRTTKL